MRIAGSSGRGVFQSLTDGRTYVSWRDAKGFTKNQGIYLQTTTSFCGKLNGECAFILDGD